MTFFASRASRVLAPRLTLGVLACALVLLFSPAAWADAPTIALSSTLASSSAGPGNTTGQSLQGHDGDINGVGYDDCIKDIEITIPVTLAPNGTSDQIQVWATNGAGTCAATDSAGNPQQTLTGPTRICWPVTDLIPVTATAQNIKVRGQDVAAYVATAATSRPTAYTRAGPEACAAEAASFNGSAPSPVTLYIAFMAGQGEDPATTPASWPATNDPHGVFLVDTVGPAAPSTAGAVELGDTLVKVNWSATSGGANVSSYVVFCSPPPNGDAAPSFDAGTVDTCATTPDASSSSDAATDGASSADAADGAVSEAGASDAGDAGDAAIVDASTPVSTSCNERGTAPDGGICVSPFVNGTLGSIIPSAYQCDTSNAAGALTITGLTNGVSYTFAVAAKDKLNNVGPITVVGCAVPEAIDDFWREYENDGGRAGGTCDLREGGTGTTALAAGIGLAAIAGALARRRRRR